MNTDSRKKEKGQKTKLKLLKSASLLFSQYGFDDVSVDAIVKEAGVSKGTFYIYFESKDALIADFLSAYVDIIEADYKAHLDTIPPGSTSSDILLSLAAKIADELTCKIGYQRIKIVYKVQITGTTDMSAILGYDRQLYRTFADIFEQGITRGEFSTSLSPDDLSKLFIMTIRGLCYEWCTRYPDFDLKEQTLMHFKLFLTGIEKTKANSSGVPRDLYKLETAQNSFETEYLL